MTEIVRRMDPADCGQLNGKASCKGCPIYATAQELIVDSMDNKPMVLQLKAQCAPSAIMDLEGLGIKQEVVTESPRPRGSLYSFVR